MFRPACFLVSLLALTGVLIFNAFAAEDFFPAAQVPAFNVPKMQTPPQIDGSINADEWRDSVRLMGVSGAQGNILIDRPISFRVAWDDTHLYISGRAHVLPGYTLLKAHREEYSAGVVGDDAFEFGIDLLGRNKLPGEVESYFKFILNYLNSGEYMKSYPSIGQSLYNWQPKMQIKSGLHDTPEGRFWEIEIAADLKDLQLSHPNEAGDQVRLLLANDAKNPGWMWPHIASNTGYLVSKGFPTATLTDAQPYLQIEKLAGLDDEKIDFQSVVYNPSDAPAKVRLNLQIRNEGTVDKIAQSKTAVNAERVLDVAAHSSARFDVSEAFPGLDYRNDASAQMRGVFDFKATLADAPDAPPILKHYLIFRKDESKPLWKYEAKPVDFYSDVQYNPIRSTLWLAADTLDARLPENTEAAGMSYTVKQGEKAVAEGRSSQLVYFKYQKLAQLPVLAPGKYQVVLSLVDKNGKALLSHTAEIEKKDEAKVFAQWWDNKIGNTEQMLHGFEPLRESGNRVACVRREYQFDSLGLPSQIVANGGSLLKAPARLKLLVAGKEYSVPVTSKLNITERKDWRISFQGAASEVAGVRFFTTGKIEQDGNVSIELKFAPAKTPVAIQKLWIEWPIDDAFGNSLACMGVGGNYSARFIGKVPSGQGDVWDTLKNIGKAGSGMTVGNFYQDLWLGTEKRGLLWWSPSDEGWVPNDETPAHSVVRSGGSTLLQNNFINTPRGEKPFVLSAPRVVNFNYNASPFKKLTPGWRINQVSAANGFSGGKYKVNWDTKEDFFSILSPPFTDQKRWAEYYAWCKTQVEASERADGLYNPDSRLVNYTTNQIALRGYMKKTVEPGLYEYFGPEWNTPDIAETLNPTYRDYMTWLMNRQVREGGAKHFYFDISFTGQTSRSISSGFGYLLPDGRIQPTGGDATLREWYRRTQAMMQDNGLAPGGVSGHATNTMPLAALPFADAILDSEFPMKDPISVFPSERMIALSNPDTFGVAINHLGFMNPDWAAFHDAGMGGGHGGVFRSPSWRNFGIGRADVHFIPYWRNADVVKSIAPGLIASLWKRPHSVIIGVMNYGAHDAAGSEIKRAAKMTLDLKSLGVPQGATVRVREMDAGALYPQQGRYMNIFKWYQELPGTPNPYDAKYIMKYRPQIAPQLDAKTGVLSGRDINFHDQTYVVLSWDDKPQSTPDFTGEMRDAALNWGLANAKPSTPQAVKVESGNVAVKAWTQPDSALLKITNTSNEQINAVLNLDLKALGVKVEKSEVWKKYLQTYALDGGKAATMVWPDAQKSPAQWQNGTAYFDGWDGVLAVRLLAGETRVICLDRN